jgi:fermentation-respiration switch protein FrsA (DUF1100 family)
MPTTIPTHRVHFHSDGIRCAAWLTLPAGAGPHPAVVLVHGFGATHDMMLPQYEQHFAAEGIATLAFDYRNAGGSGGQPRQHISLRNQRTDVTAALAFLTARPPPGSTAVVTLVGAEAGWNSTVPPGGQFENRVAAADAVGLVFTSALRHVRNITAPLLVCVCDRENLIDPKYVELAARRTPRGEARHYDSDHFEIYHPPLVDRALADQIAFLREHLDVRA